MTPSPRSAADRITPRDAQMLRLIAEHRVLTSAQLTAALFTHDSKARSRISLLRGAGLIETFRPVLPRNQPSHCVVTGKGLRVLGGSWPAQFSPRSDVALAAAVRPDLEHLLGVNSFFCNLLAVARRGPERCLEVWLSEWSTAARFPGQLRPDAFGRWRDGEVWCEFFLEYDTGSEPLHRLMAKLSAYTDIADAADVHSPVLFWLRTPGRERHFHELLGRECPVPVATAVGDPATADVAGAIWKSTFFPKRLVLADLGPATADHLGFPQRSHEL
jgi:hypothetical protein